MSGRSGTRQGPTDLDRLNSAFGELRARGWLAYQSLDGCPECCNAFIEGEIEGLLGRVPSSRDTASANVAFWHSDGLRVFTPGYSWDEGPQETIFHELFVHWSGDACELRLILERHGLATAWAGGPEDSVAILPSVVPPFLVERGM